MKIISSFITSMICTSSLLASICTEDSLPFYRKSTYFNVFCEAQDQDVAEEVVKENVSFIAELEERFDYKFETKIALRIFPDIDQFHQSIYKKAMQPWLVAYYGENVIRIVSPNNPGTIHTKEKVKRSVKNGLSYILLENRYEDLAASRWFRSGTTFFITGEYNFNSLKKLTYYTTHIPTIEELEQKQQDPHEYEAINGYLGSYSLARFINDHFGWETILKLLDNYNDLESIVGMNKQELRDQWIASLSTD